MRGRPRQARAAADQAIANSTSMQIRFLAGRIYAQTGAIAQARGIARQLSAELQAEPQAYGKIIEGVLALEQKDARLAIKAAVRSDGAARHLDRPVRSRPRLPRRRGVPAGRLRVRPLPQAKR